MTIREELEQRERTYLSPFAVCSADTKGRERPMDPCPLRTEFQRDREMLADHQISATDQALVIDLVML